MTAKTLSSRSKLYATLIITKKEKKKNSKTNTESRTKQKIKFLGNGNLCENSSYQNWETPATDNLQTLYRIHHPSNRAFPSMIENIDLNYTEFQHQ